MHVSECVVCRIRGERLVVSVSAQQAPASAQDACCCTRVPGRRLERVGREHRAIDAALGERVAGAGFGREVRARHEHEHDEQQLQQLVGAAAARASRPRHNRVRVGRRGGGGGDAGGRRGGQQQQREQRQLARGLRARAAVGARRGLRDELPARRGARARHPPRPQVQEQCAPLNSPMPSA